MEKVKIFVKPPIRRNGKSRDGQTVLSIIREGGATVGRAIRIFDEAFMRRLEAVSMPLSGGILHALGC